MIFSLRSRFSLLVFLLSLVLISPTLEAAFSKDDKGTTSANFLKLGVGARAVAMGEAFTAVADDATALYWNPAGLVRMPAHGGSATFMHAPYIESSYYDWLGVGKRIGSAGAWGAGIQYFSAGSIPQTDRLGNDTGEFTPNDLAFSLGYAHPIGSGAFGVSGKFIRSKIVDSAQTVAADVGLASPLLINNRLRFAAVATNLGGQLKFDEEKEDLPLAFKVGASYRLTDAWLAAADIAAPRDNQPNVALGTEYRWRIGAESFLAMRGGFNSRTVSDLSGFHSVSAGVGFAIRAFTIDYAFLPFGSLGLTHRISLGLRWGEVSDTEHLSAVKRSREAAAKRQRCDELYGGINCRETDGGIPEPAQPGNPIQTPRPW